jgi:hypothetical protein
MESKVTASIYCPRCQGRVFRDKDQYGWYEQCIRCGHIGYLDVAETERLTAKKTGVKTGDRMSR